MKINDMFPAVMIFLLVAILIGVGLTILGTLSTSIRADQGVVDDTFTADNESCVAVATYVTTSTATFTNSTDGATDITGYFTWDNTGKYAGTCVTLTNAGAEANYVGTTINATYTRGQTTTAQAKVDTSITSIGGFVTWFAIIVLVIAAGIVIDIVRKSFTGR